MTDIFNEVVQQVTAKGQMFETKEVLNDNGVTYTEYANFAENLKQFFDIGLAHEEKIGWFTKMKDIPTKKFMNGRHRLLML